MSGQSVLWRDVSSKCWFFAYDGFVCFASPPKWLAGTFEGLFTFFGLGFRVSSTFHKGKEYLPTIVAFLGCLGNIFVRRRPPRRSSPASVCLVGFALDRPMRILVSQAPSLFSSLQQLFFSRQFLKNIPGNHFPRTSRLASFLSYFNHIPLPFFFTQSGSFLTPFDLHVYVLTFGPFFVLNFPPSFFHNNLLVLKRNSFRPFRSWS